jgi:hypothetical protein
MMSRPPLPEITPPAHDPPSAMDLVVSASGAHRVVDAQESADEILAGAERRL